MSLQFPAIRTLEVHPVPFTRLLHHPFASGPRERDGLGVPLLLQAIGDSAALGYNLLHIAGDRPLLCPALHSMCGEAHRNRMRTTLNLAQRALTPRLLDELQGAVDHICVVLEGRPALQGRLRHCQRLKLVRERGFGFSLIFTATRGNLNDLEWAAQFAIEHGASALKVRTFQLSELQLATAWMILEFLRDLCRNRLTVGFDAPNRHCPPISHSELLRWSKNLADKPETLGHVISPLVIDETGLVLPLRRDFPRQFALGSLHIYILQQLAEFWIERCGDTFANVYTDSLLAAESGRRPEANFFDLLAEEAGRSRPAAFAAAG